MLAARGATSSATKRRTRPTSSACSAFGSLSPRIVTGPASTQLHLYLPCGVPQERDEPFELLHRVPELKGRRAQRGCRAAVAADHGHAYCPDPLFVFLIVRRVPALPVRRSSSRSPSASVIVRGVSLSRRRRERISSHSSSGRKATRHLPSD